MASRARRQSSNSPTASGPTIHARDGNLYLFSATPDGKGEWVREGMLEKELVDEYNNRVYKTLFPSNSSREASKQVVDEDKPNPGDVSENEPTSVANEKEGSQVAHIAAKDALNQEVQDSSAASASQSNPRASKDGSDDVPDIGSLHLEPERSPHDTNAALPAERQKSSTPVSATQVKIFDHVDEDGAYLVGTSYEPASWMPEEDVPALLLQQYRDSHPTTDANRPDDEKETDPVHHSQDKKETADNLEDGGEPTANLRNDDGLNERVRDCLSYTRYCLTSGTPILQYTRFALHPASPAHQEALTSLRRVSALPIPLATFISSSPSHETYEVGCSTIHSSEGSFADPHWWVGKSPAEIKAGPRADESEIRRIEGVLRGMETRRRRSSGERRVYHGMVKVPDRAEEDGENGDEGEEEADC